MFDRLFENSMPSGHTQTAFTVASVLVWALSKASKLRVWNGAAVLLVASIVGLSRIYVGAHFPVDVVVGALVGAGTGWGSCWGVNFFQRRPL